MFNYYVLELIWLVIIIIILIYIYIYIVDILNIFSFILKTIARVLVGPDWTGDLWSEKVLHFRCSTDFWSEKYMHLRFSICTVWLSTCTLWGEHVHTYTYTSAYAHLQVGMCTPPLQHVSLDFSQLHWSYS